MRPHPGADRAAGADARRVLPATVEHYLRHTGLLANFGTTVLLGFLVGVAVAGQTFYTFVVENLPYFAVLKAMGTSNARLRGVVLLQAAFVSAVGYGLGVGLAAGLGELTRAATPSWSSTCPGRCWSSPARRSC